MEHFLKKSCDLFFMKSLENLLKWLLSESLFGVIDEEIAVGFSTWIAEGISGEFLKEITGETFKNISDNFLLDSLSEFVKYCEICGWIRSDFFKEFAKVFLKQALKKISINPWEIF